MVEILYPVLLYAPGMKVANLTFCPTRSGLLLDMGSVWNLWMWACQQVYQRLYVCATGKMCNFVESRVQSLSVLLQMAFSGFYPRPSSGNSSILPRPGRVVGLCSSFRHLNLEYPFSRIRRTVLPITKLFSLLFEGFLDANMYTVSL